MKIASLIDPKLVKCGLSARTKDEALNEIVGVMASGTPGVTAEELRAALSEREKLGPFSMAKGSAFPHARTEKVSEFRIAVGTAPEGIDFKAPDGNLIRVIVLFAIPKKHSNLYIHTLAQFLNLFSAEENLKQVLGASGSEELLEAIDAASSRGAAVPAVQGVPSVGLTTPLSKAMELFASARLDELPVVDDEGKLVGELTASSVLQLAVREHFLGTANSASLQPGGKVEAALRIYASSPLEGLGVVSTNGYRTVQEGEPLAETAVKLSAGGGRAYVLRGQKLVGIVGAGEVLGRLAGGK